MEKELISRIVPGYEVEEYLDDCIKSIVNQTYTNLEIILVDDGSKDQCPKICDAWSEKDKRIKVIHKSNGGLSDARNAGMSIAEGNYIAFVDSDDKIENVMYEEMMSVLKEEDADIVECGTNYFKENTILRKVFSDTRCCVDNKNAMRALISETIFHQTVWNKLYKKECINSLKFFLGKCNEDEFWTYQVFSNAKKIVAIPDCYYQYRQRENSIMDKFSLKRLDAIEARYERMQVIQRNYPEFLESEKVNFVLSCVYFYQKILQNPQCDMDGFGKHKLRRYVKKVSFSSSELMKMNVKQLLYISMAKISLSACAKIRNCFRIGYL